MLTSDLSRFDSADPSAAHIPASFTAFVGAAEPDGELDLEIGALLLARDADPGLDVRVEIQRLDALYASLDPARWEGLEPDAAARALAHALFEEHAFAGNSADYGDPRNSHLPQVVERKLGIPISLSVLYLSMARRLDLPASGVSFPGHFLVRIERSSGPLVLDPFHAGRALGFEDLLALLRRATHPQARMSTDHLRRSSGRQILQRILQNLKISYASRGALSRALLACSRILELSPDERLVLRDRGVLQAKLGLPEGACADLKRYLEIVPDAADAVTIRQAIVRLSERRKTIALN